MKEDAVIGQDRENIRKSQIDFSCSLLESNISWGNEKERSFQSEMELLRFFHPFHKASESLRKSKGKEAEVGKYLEGLMFMSQITLSYFAALKLLGLFYFFVLRITDLFPIIQSVLCVQQSLFWLWSDEC